MTEQEYDTLIEPKLKELAEHVMQLGGSLVARVEWAPGEAGITHAGVTNASGAAQRLAYIAALCRGNLDHLVITAMKTMDTSATMVARFMALGDKP
jgi:hypothetical protein